MDNSISCSLDRYIKSLFNGKPENSISFSRLQKSLGSGFKLRLKPYLSGSATHTKIRLFTRALGIGGAALLATHLSSSYALRNWLTSHEPPEVVWMATLKQKGYSRYETPEDLRDLIPKRSVQGTQDQYFISSSKLWILCLAHPNKTSTETSDTLFFQHHLASASKLPPKPEDWDALGSGFEALEKLSAQSPPSHIATPRPPARQISPGFRDPRQIQF